MSASPRTSFLAYAALLAAHIALVWLLPYFPSQDGPSHIYNLVILRDLLNGGKEWGGYFSASLHAVPNLGFNLVAYPLLKFLPPLAVEKAFITIYLMLMAIGVPVLLRAFDRPALPLSFLVFPVMFNFTLMMGFYSYALAVPLFLIAFALAWKVRARSNLCKFVCFNLVGLVIYYIHLIPFMLYLLSLGAITIAEANGINKTGKKLLQLVLLVSPLLLNLVLYLRTGATKTGWDMAYLFDARRGAELLVDLLTFSTTSFIRWQMIPGRILMVFVVLLTYLSARNILRKKFQKHEITEDEKTLILLILGMMLIYFYGPFRLGEGSYFNQRLPWVVLLAALPLLHLPGTGPMQRVTVLGALGIASIFLALNTTAFLLESAKVKNFLSGLSADMSKGSLVMTYNRKGPTLSRIDVLRHSASYYGIIKGSVDVGNYETGVNFFPIKFSDTHPAMPSLAQAEYYPESINWTDFPAVHFLLGWGLSDSEKERIGRYFHVIKNDEQFTLWKRNCAGA